MKRSIFPMLFVFSLTASAQDWALFPLDQRSVYVDSTQTPLSTEQHTMDSVRISGDHRSVYFDQASRNGSYYGCEQTTGTPQLGSFAPFAMDSLVEVMDTVYFHSAFSTSPFYFIPGATLGQSWTVVSSWPGNAYDAITITCSLVGVETFLGLTDSVKVFSLVPNGSSPGQTPISDQQFVLSKHYGLLEYVPFEQFLYHPANSQFLSRKLAGLQIGATTAGYQRPATADYFHLAPGDLRSWELHRRPAFASDPETFEFLKDSITAATSLNDSVNYTFDRTYYHYDGSITEHLGLTESYFLPAMASELDAAGNGIALGPSVSNGALGLFINSSDQPMVWTALPHKWVFEPLLGSTVEQVSLLNAGAFLDTGSCNFYEATDLGSELDLDNWAGVTRLYVYNINETTQTLVGFRINGIVKGLLAVGVVQPRIIERSTLSIQPNPARESITILGIGQAMKGEFSVFDGLGRAVLHGSLPSVSISVEGLLPGLYVAQVRLQDTTATARFVKE